MTVSFWSTTEAIAFYTTGKSLTFARTNHIDTFANSKCFDGHLLTNIDFGILGAELAQDTKGGDFIGFEMSQFATC